jgi:superfamily I DNA and RNA helicase
VLSERQDDLAAAIEQRFMGFKELRDGRRLRVPVNVVTLLPQIPLQDHGDALIVSPDTLVEGMQRFARIDEADLRRVNAAIQRLTTIKPVNKRVGVQRPDSRGAIIKEIEREIANLDQWQKRAAIEIPDGPQRIRGLAGSGKTVVLALKAAYLHVLHPEWKIAITFQTRSLYQQFKDLVRRFTFEHLNDEPNWDNLRILHAWGSSSNQPGVYSEIAASAGAPVRDFGFGKKTYGYGAAFGGVCRELVSFLDEHPHAPIYDALLIDEAQDLPPSFFELAIRATPEPHRVVFAYDELQNLGDYSMAPPAELFGQDANGQPRVPNLDTGEGQPARDIVLPVCYRNTPWALTVAHALGFGIYRREGTLVQFFDDLSLIRDVGYDIVEGDLAAGAHVTLKRSPKSAPDYFARLLTSDDAVQTHVFASKAEQAASVAEMIDRNLREDELEFRDVLVILPEALTAPQESAALIAALGDRGIPAHLAGVTTSRDKFFDEGSVTISGIFRAKGNEAPMIYVLNADFCLSGPELGRRRNIIFTAITRSRAWVRICGTGERMARLAAEVNEVVAQNFTLAFQVPTAQEMERMRRIHRDATPDEKSRARRVEANLMKLVEQYQRGELPLDLSPAMKRSLRVLLEEEPEDE